MALAGTVPEADILGRVAEAVVVGVRDDDGAPVRDAVACADVVAEAVFVGVTEAPVDREAVGVCVELDVAVAEAKDTHDKRVREPTEPAAPEAVEAARGANEPAITDTPALAFTQLLPPPPPL